jgi:hypothetical protein
MKLTKSILCSVLFLSAAVTRADDAVFDLPGPKIDVFVTRGNTTLPIAQVPELQAHDKLRVKADLPATQSNHLLVIVAFLRGTTNEPPDDWFTKIETWKQPFPEGTVIEVPDGAQRAMLFVAPETGGDFATLRSAVKGSPGLFIRASMSLNKASFEQQRIERYLAGMRAVTSDDEKVIQARSTKLASALALKPHAACFKQPVEDQVDCLTQASTPLLLDDGHGPTISDAISTGASGDFFNEAGQADNAVYSAYVGTLIDLIHLVGMLHTAHYRYIPAISFPQGPTLNLKLNAAPSFYNPKSVIVIALPAIQEMRRPPLVMANPAQVFCLANPAMMLPLRGDPLMYSTAFAHELTIDFGPSAAQASIPLTPDAFDGGLMRADTNPRQTLQAAASSEAQKSSPPSRFPQGKIRGYWGFEAFEGPTLAFQQSEGDTWKLTGADALIAGKNGQLTLQGGDTACLSQARLVSPAGENLPVTFAPATTGTNTMNLEVPLLGKQPGAYSLMLKIFGDSSERKFSLNAFSADIHLDKLLISMSGETAVVSGKGVDNVLSAKIGEQIFLPATPGDDNGSLELIASRKDVSATASSAVVTLKDGRVIHVPVASEDSAATLRLLSLHSTIVPPPGELEVTLNSPQHIPLHSTLHFVVQSTGPFTRSQTIEVATADGALHTSLSLNSDSLILQDEHTAVGTVNLDKAFGESAFGELRLRAIPGDGTFGNWVTLGKLVRRPQITAVRCTDRETPTCMIEGRDLFLALAFSTSESFESEVPVPSGFDETTFAIPLRPSEHGTTLYVRLRDDPEAVAMIQVPGRDAKP